MKINVVTLDLLQEELRTLQTKEIEFVRFSRSLQIVQLPTFMIPVLLTEIHYLGLSVVALLTALIIYLIRMQLSLRVERYKSNLVLSLEEKLLDDFVRKTYDYELYESRSFLASLSKLEPLIISTIVSMSIFVVGSTDVTATFLPKLT